MRAAMRLMVKIKYLVDGKVAHGSLQGGCSGHSASSEVSQTWEVWGLEQYVLGAHQGRYRSATTASVEIN